MSDRKLSFLLWDWQTCNGSKLIYMHINMYSFTSLPLQKHRGFGVKNSVQVAVGHTETYLPQTLWYHQNHPILRLLVPVLHWKTLCAWPHVYTIVTATYKIKMGFVKLFFVCIPFPGLWRGLYFHNTDWSTEDHHWKSRMNFQVILSPLLFSHPWQCTPLFPSLVIQDN